MSSCVDTVIIGGETGVGVAELEAAISSLSLPDTLGGGVGGNTWGGTCRVSPGIVSTNEDEVERDCVAFQKSERVFILFHRVELPAIASFYHPPPVHRTMFQPFVPEIARQSGPSRQEVRCAL